MRLRRGLLAAAAGGTAGWFLHDLLTPGRQARIQAGDVELHYGGLTDEAVCGRSGVTTTTFSMIITCAECRKRVDQMLAEADAGYAPRA